MKWLLAGIRDALTHPLTDRAAKANVAVWCVLLTVVSLNLVMALLMGTLGWVTAVVTVAGLGAYAVFLKWALAGLAYRKTERRVFDEIVGNV